MPIRQTKNAARGLLLQENAARAEILIGENMPLQHAESGDIVAVCATGAYNYSMSSNYNRLQKPAVVFVNNGESRIAVKRETLDDIIRNDI